VEDGVKKLLLLLFITLILYMCTQTESQTEKFEFKDIYDETADAQLDIANAVLTAQKNDNRVLLMFGADWCPWCQRLHHTL